MRAFDWGGDGASAGPTCKLPVVPSSAGSRRLLCDLVWLRGALGGPLDSRAVLGVVDALE